MVFLCLKCASKNCTFVFVFFLMFLEDELFVDIFLSMRRRVQQSNQSNLSLSLSLSLSRHTDMLLISVWLLLRKKMKYIFFSRQVMKTNMLAVCL